MWKTLVLSAFLVHPAAVFGQFFYYVPHIIDGRVDSIERYQTAFAVMNPSSTNEVNVTVKLKSRNGSSFDRFSDIRRVQEFSFVSFTLKPRSGGIFPKTSSFRDAAAGWAEVEATGEVSVTAHLEAWLPTGSLKSIVTLHAEPLVQELLSEVHVNTIGSTGVALLNPSKTEAAAIRIELFGDLDPVNPVAARTILVPPQTNIAAFIDQDDYFNNLLPRNSSGQLFNGVMRIATSVPVSAALVLVEGPTWRYWPAFKKGN